MSNARGRTLAKAVAALVFATSLPLLAATGAGAAVPTEPPSDLSPADGAEVGANPQLAWVPAPGAVRHRVQVSANAGFSPLLFNAITYNRTYTPISALPNGTIYWRVAGMDASGSGEGPYAQSSFTKGLEAPVPLAPAQGAVLDFPTNAPSLSWSAVPASKSYVLEVDDATDFIGASRYVTVNTGFTPPDPLPAGPAPSGKPYYWRVQGASVANGTGVLTEWSVPRQFGITWNATANLLKPAAGAKVTDVEFSWDPVPGARAYNVQVDLDETFGNPVTLDVVNAHSNRVSYRTALPNSAYWWRVQAIDSKLNVGVWTTPRQFTREWLAPPTQLLPAPDAVTSGNLRFEWSAVDHASRYEIQFAKDANFSVNPATCVTTQTAIYDGEDCDVAVTAKYPGGAFYWRVRAHDEPSGPPILGVWSTSRHHSGHTLATVGTGPNPPAPVTTTSPPTSCAGGSICTLRGTPTFSWEPSPGATSYQVYLALDPNFTTLVSNTGSYFFATSGRQTAYVPLRSLPDNNAGQSYYWFVRPCSTSCGPDPAGAFPAVQSSRFQQTSRPVELLTPVNNGTQSFSPRFEWEDYLITTAGSPADPAPGTTDLEAKSYQIQVSTVPSFASLVDDKVVDQTFFTPWDRTYPEGPLYWRVRAIDGSNNNLTWSENVGSPAQPRVFTLTSPAPVQSAPADGATVQGTPTLKWQPQTHTALYEFEVYKNADPNYSVSNRVLTGTTAHIEYSGAAALPPGQYSWRVRRRDTDDRPAAWSHEVGDTPRTFTVAASTGPTLVAPLDGAVVDDAVVFSWNAVPRAATYRFQRSTSSTFTSVIQVDTVMTVWAPPELVQKGSWYWRVLAFDGSGGLLSTSATRTVVKDVLPGAPTAVGATAGDASATVSWTAPAPTGGTAVARYVVTPYIGTVAQPSRTTAGATPTSLVVTGLTNGTTYTFRVAASIPGGTGPQSAPSNQVTPVAPPAVAKSVYVPITPCRVVDTRAQVGPLATGQVRSYQVAGGGQQFAAQGGSHGGCFVPDGASAVEASVTAVSPSANGYFRAWPNGQVQPNATFLNFTRGHNVTNTGAIALAPTGQLDLAVANYGATTHYVIDLQGYFVTPDAVPTGVTGAVYVPVAPCRVVDTRQAGGTFGASVQRDYQVAGTGTGFAAQGGKSGGCGVPKGAAAVEASVTAVTPGGNGYFRAWPLGEASPNATFLNYVSGQGITNTGAIKLAATGTKDLSVRNYSATSHYVIDVQGYFVVPAAVPSGSVGSRFVAVSPCRVVDTRTAGGQLGANEQRTYQVGGTGAAFAAQGGKSGGCAIPGGAAAVEASVTAASPRATGFFRAWPADQAAPNATFLNYSSGENITNTGAISLAPAGSTDLAVQNYSLGSHYVIDVQGYYSP